VQHSAGTCGVKPHSDATLVTSRTLPLKEDSDLFLPSMSCKRREAQRDCHGESPR